MYVIIINGNVELGPMAWKKTFFQNFLKEEIDRDVSLPVQYTTPIIEEEYQILPSKFIYDPIDERLFQYHGPFWNITETEAIGTFKKVPKNIESVKNNLRKWITDNRWKKENGGIKYTIGDNIVTIPTSRESRGQFQINTTVNVMWKFAECWVSLTQDDLIAIYSKILEHVQNCFVEEYELLQEVSSATTLEELKSLQERLNVDVVC